MFFQEVPETADSDLPNEPGGRGRRSRRRRNRPDRDTASRETTRAWRRRRATLTNIDDDGELEDDDPAEQDTLRPFGLRVATGVDDVEECRSPASEPRLTKSEECTSRQLLADAPDKSAGTEDGADEEEHGELDQDDDEDDDSGSEPVFDHYRRVEGRPTRWPPTPYWRRPRYRFSVM